MEKSTFDQAEFAATMERVAGHDAHGDGPMRPGFDPVQHRDVVAESVHGRKVEDYKQALERAGFVFWPRGSVPPGCEAPSILEPPRPLTEGQWRRMPDRKLKRPLAMTDAQVTAWFETPEALWLWIKNLANIDKIKRAQQERDRKIMSVVPR